MNECPLAGLDPAAATVRIPEQRSIEIPGTRP